MAAGAADGAAAPVRFLATLLLLCAGAAQAAAAPAPPCARDTRASCTSDAPFLWRVTGAKTQHYLMGSVHLLPEAAYPLPAALDTAYTSAAGIVLESDLTALNDPQTQAQLLDAGLAPQGIKAEIGNDLYRELSRWIGDKKLPAALCDRYKGWLCAMTLEILSFEQSDYRPDLGLDQHYHARAQTEHKTVQWLEEPRAHLQLFTGMNREQSLQMLRSVLDEQGGEGGSPEQLLALWQHADVAGLEKLLREFQQQQPALYERLLVARNRAWLPKLERLFAGDKAQLVIVGAAHLAGSDSVIAQLARRGYRVEAVPLQP